MSKTKKIYERVIKSREAAKLSNRFPRFFSFIKKRLDPDAELGLNLTIGALIGFFLLFLFFVVLQDVVYKDPLVQADERLLAYVELLRTPILSKILLFFTYVGQWQSIFIATLFSGIVLFLLDKRRYLFTLLFSVVVGQLIVTALKDLVNRPRPSLVNAITVERSFSFPSGHAFIVFSFFGLIAYFLYKYYRQEWLRLLIVIGSVAILLLISFSRIYLGVHWPSDVLASFAAGGAWLTAMITSLEIREKRRTLVSHPRMSPKKVEILGFIFFFIWLGFLFYYYQGHSYATVTRSETEKIAQTVSVDVTNIPELFNSIPKKSEGLTGHQMEPINLIFVGSKEKLDQAFLGAGWYRTDQLTPVSLAKLIGAFALDRNYSRAPGLPSFWDKRPNDFSYELPNKDSLSKRQHIHVWTTPYKTKDGQEIFIATAHFDEGLELSHRLFPTHKINPDVDLERQAIEKTLTSENKITKLEQFQIVPGQTGKNEAGDAFNTDGKCLIVFLK